MLSGDETIADLLNNRSVFISFITERELLGYKDINPEDIGRIESFLTEVTIIDINFVIKKIVVSLRKSFKIKLPDAIIAASSYYLNLPLFTADKALSKLSELNVLLYKK